MGPHGTFLSYYALNELSRLHLHMTDSVTLIVLRDLKEACKPYFKRETSFGDTHYIAEYVLRLQRSKLLDTIYIMNLVLLQKYLA